MLLRKWILLFLFCSTSIFAFLPITPLNINLTSGYCPRTIDCSYGANFLSLSDANYCGCCTCHGGAIGCAGGAKGRVICADTTVADACNCQYLITPTSLGYTPAPFLFADDSL